ncbi:MAG: NAD-binding protein [Methylococcales bacterium]|nr:NAD-binding protein [Methylococcales bacterium]MDP3837396.1 NAD-binding protein [Methylococcales bacterium]
MKQIVVFGYSVMSLEVMKRLNSKQHTLLFVSEDEDEAERITEQGFNTTVIDFRNDDELKAIGIGSSVDIIFCFYPTDSDNVFLTISARALDKELTIIAIVDDPESAEKLLAAGANKIIDPYEICARRTHNMLTKPDVTNMLDNTVFGQHDLNIAQIEIPSGSYLEDSKSSDLGLAEKYNLILIGIVDRELGDALHFAISEKKHILNTGDVLVVLGPSREIKHFKEAVNGGYICWN